MRGFQNDCPHVQRPCPGRTSALTWPALILASSTLCPLPGCADKLAPPAYLPDVAARQALAEYDKNGDGYLDLKELEQCPALRSSLEYLDTNGDRRLNADEIAARVRMYQASQVALYAKGLRV